MPVVTEAPKTNRTRVPTIDHPPPPRVPPEEGGGGEDSSRGRGGGFPVSAGKIGLWILLTVVVMLFAGLSSAYIVLRGLPSWQNVALPPVLWANTAIILVSSVTMELTRRAVRDGRIGATKRWIAATTALGLGFLVGQVVAWAQMVDAGIYLPSTLHSSFLYVLTGMHALHLVGGVGALVYVLRQTFRNRYTRASHEPIVLCGTYWHFMDGLWVYLFLMFALA